VKNLVNGYLATDDIAPMILFYDGPASNAFTAARHSFYGWSATPTFQIDGLHQQVGWNQGNIENYIDSRLATPTYLDITVSISGNASGGTATYYLTAEQDLGISNLRLYSAIVESGDIAGSGYGFYAGQTMVWEPRVWPCGTTGYSINFTGPYPQTLEIDRSYTLNPSEHTFDMLDVVTFVQTSSGNREVVNAAFMDLPDTGTGIGTSAGPVTDDLLLMVGPNPATGITNILSVIPAGVTGTIRVFDLQGRVVGEFPAGGTSSVAPDEPGLYFVRMETSTGAILTERFTLIR
jgi:hypothetical protein